MTLGLLNNDDIDHFSCKPHHKRLVLNKCGFGVSFLPEKAAESSPEMQIPEKCFSRQCKTPQPQSVGSFVR